MAFRIHPPYLALTNHHRHSMLFKIRWKLHTRWPHDCTLWGGWTQDRTPNRARSLVGFDVQSGFNMTLLIVNQWSGCVTLWNEDCVQITYFPNSQRDVLSSVIHGTSDRDWGNSIHTAMDPHLRVSQAESNHTHIWSLIKGKSMSVIGSFMMVKGIAGAVQLSVAVWAL